LVVECDSKVDKTPQEKIIKDLQSAVNVTVVQQGNYEQGRGPAA